MLLNQYHITSSEWELKRYQRSLYLCHKLCFCMMRASKGRHQWLPHASFLEDKRWLSSTLKQAADLCSPVSARDKLGTKGVNPVSFCIKNVMRHWDSFLVWKRGSARTEVLGTRLYVCYPKELLWESHTFVLCLSTRLCTQLPLYPVIHTLGHTQGIVSVLYFYLGPHQSQKSCWVRKQASIKAEAGTGIVGEVAVAQHLGCYSCHSNCQAAVN